MSTDGCRNARVDIAMVIDGSGSIRDSMSQDIPGVNNWDLLKIFLQQVTFGNNTYLQRNSLSPFNSSKRLFEIFIVSLLILNFEFLHAMHQYHTLSRSLSVCRYARYFPREDQSRRNFVLK